MNDSSRAVVAAAPRSCQKAKIRAWLSALSRSDAHGLQESRRLQPSSWAESPTRCIHSIAILVDDAIDKGVDGISQFPRQGRQVHPSVLKHAISKLY